MLKRIVLAVFLVSLFVAGDNISAKVTKESVHNPSWVWVTVKNPDGVKNGNGHFDFNDSCGVAEGGRVASIKTVGSKVLVMYTSPNDQGYGSECGNGTVFWMDKNKYDTAEAEYNKMIAERKAEKEYIYRLLRYGNHSPSK